MRPETDAALRALPAWQNIAAVATTQKQDDIAVWLTHIHDAVADGLDVRVNGNAATAAALRGEAVRLLRESLHLGLNPHYTQRIENIVADIEADELAVKVPHGMATIGWQSLAGKRGRAADADGALRGWLVRQVANILPADTPSRYKTIAAIVTFVGVKCSQQLARSVLLKGRT